MGDYTHPTRRLPPNLRNIPPSPFLSLEPPRNSLLIHLSFFLSLLKWLISCTTPGTRNSCRPGDHGDGGLAGFGMTRGVKNETRDTTMQLHRRVAQVKPVVRAPRNSEDE
jgi:hypothetical protein